jgi:hypothetical protein
MNDVPQQCIGPEGPGFEVQMGGMPRLVAAVLHAPVVDAFSAHTAACNLLQFTVQQRSTLLDRAT